MVPTSGVGVSVVRIYYLKNDAFQEPGSAYNWMAPELMRREAVAEEVDVYGFFVTLWEFFTGEIPWAKHDWKAILNKVLMNKLCSVLLIARAGGIYTFLSTTELKFRRTIVLQAWVSSVVCRL